MGCGYRFKTIPYGYVYGDKLTDRKRVARRRTNGRVVNETALKSVSRRQC